MRLQRGKSCNDLYRKKDSFDEDLTIRKDDSFNATQSNHDENDISETKNEA